MDPREFRALDAGRIVRTLQGYHAFVPAPLPPQITYDEGLFFRLSQADALISELSGLGRHLPNPHLLISPYVRREAVLSSRIEGTRASLSDVLLDEVGEPATVERAADVQEVRNYISALEYGIARLAELPLSERLVREIHQRLMAGVRGDQATPGEFRRTQNWIGPPGSTLSDAAYVPLPPDEMLECLHQWEYFLHQHHAIPDLVQCALVHEQFEAIHPFLDGNGRVGRLLITLFLIERGRLSQPLLYLSAYFESHRQDYYHLLQSVRTDGNWTAWLQFFLVGVSETAHAALRQAGELIDLREQYRRMLMNKPKALTLLDMLFRNPYITISRAKELLRASTPAARDAVLALRESGLLEEITGRAWGRVYCATPILRIVESDG